MKSAEIELGDWLFTCSSCNGAIHEGAFWITPNNKVLCVECADRREAEAPEDIDLGYSIKIPHA